MTRRNRESTQFQEHERGRVDVRSRACLKADWLDLETQTARSPKTFLIQLQEKVDLCADGDTAIKMLSSEQILEEAARDGSIDVYVYLKCKRDLSN